MARAVPRPVSDFFDKEHRAAGVKLLLDTGVEAFEGSGQLEAVRAGGKTYAADMALVGIGVVPNLELARDAGLACEDGIMVDQNCATADPAIFAAGDCTWHVGREGIPLRLKACRTPSIRPGMRPTRWWESQNPIAKFLVSGPTSTI